LQPILEAIRASKKPFIYAGGGVTHSSAAAELTAFAELTGIPVGLTLHGLGNFPADHYLCLQMLGMHGTAYSNYAINEADLLLAFGVRFDDRVTGKLTEFAKHGKIVHIDVDKSEIHKNKFAHIPVHGDLKPALTELNKMLADDANADLVAGGRYTDWMRQIDAWRGADPMAVPQNEQAIISQYAISRLHAILKQRGQLDDTIITTGVGQHQMWAAQFFPFNKPRHWITSGGLGTMGFGLPAAMGAKVAFPNKLCIDIDGDGSFLMNIQELACCKTEKIAPKVLLLNNQHLGMVVQWEDRFFGSNRGHTYLGAGEGEPPYPDFEAVAKGFGIASRTVTEKIDLDAALIEMIESDGPYVLNVMVPHQEHVLPMIPSGMTVRDMIKA
jgi:acetolactate synthase I/II/III large subunit